MYYYYLAPGTSNYEETMKAVMQYHQSLQLPMSAVLKVRTAKGQAIANEVFTQWNSFSRVAVTQQANGDRSIVIDGDAATAIARFDFDHLTPHERRGLREQGPAPPYNLRPGAKTLIIGPGGGGSMVRPTVSPHVPGIVVRACDMTGN